MLIWGSKGRIKLVGQGQFYCPRCESFRPYKQHKVGKYFTLYFIPVFETSTLGEYVECQVCLTTFKPEVLTFSPSSSGAESSDPGVQRLIGQLGEALDRGAPVQVAMEMLVDAGATRESASKALKLATNGALRLCPRCGAAYKATLAFCGMCGERLVAAE